MGSSSSKIPGAESPSATSLGTEFPSGKPANVRNCPEECDEKIREAEFAFRSTDLGSWTSFISSGSSGAGDGSTTNTTVFKRLQHWSLVVHFPRGDKTYLFEAGQDKNTGLLQASRTENVDKKVFENALYMYCGTLDTCPRELLELAKKVKSNGTPYDLTTNNCQTWLEEFLKLISPKLFKSFEEMLNGYTVKTVTTTAAVTAGFAFLYAILKQGNTLFISSASV
uniref:Uncharacterized protein n=1 Tax=Daphnia galeata TaxID=27404 RepID=A0A8J2RQL6_9CRUS|nr:unnamed protein product [Daphnia galeata]